MRLRIRIGLIILFLLAVTYSPLFAFGQVYTLNNSTFYRVETVYYLENKGNSRAEDIVLDLQLGNEYLTKNMPYSLLLSSLYIPEPGQVIKDDAGNLTGRYYIGDLNPGEERSLKITNNYRVSEISYQIEPEKIGPYTPLIRVLSPYLLPTPGIECQDPLIVNKAKEITQGETNPYLIAKKIFAFINTHMHYASKESDPANKGALSALKTGSGVCEDYSDLMVALLRAAGVPSRTVTGWMGQVDSQLITADKSGVKLPGHIWVEYYLPNYGWIPADPTYTYLYNGVSTVDYRRLTGLSELRYAQNSQMKEPAASYSYYGGKVDISFMMRVTKSEKLSPVDISKEPVTLYLEGIPLICDVEPLIIEGRTLVPLRGIFSALGAQVDWNELEQKVTITSSEKTVILKIGSKIAQVDGSDVILDTEAQIVNDRTLVPLRFIGESLGVKVQWDGEMKTIDLIKEK